MSENNDCRENAYPQIIGLIKTVILRLYIVRGGLKAQI